MKIAWRNIFNDRCRELVIILFVFKCVVPAVDAARGEGKLTAAEAIDVLENG